MISNNQKKLMLDIFNILISRNLSKNQSQILISEIGRENSFLPKNIFKSHVDPHRGVNIGMLSWQGSRGEMLKDILSKEGLLIDRHSMKPSKRSLEVQVDFILYEINNQKMYNDTKRLFLNNPNVSYELGVKVLGKNYIRWRFDDPKYRKGHYNRDIFYKEILKIT